MPAIRLWMFYDIALAWRPNRTFGA